MLNVDARVYADGMGAKVVCGLKNVGVCQIHTVE